MVFRYSLKDLKRKWEGLDYKSPAMATMQGCIISQLHSFCDQDFRSFPKNWYLLAYMLLIGNNNVIEDARKDMLYEEMCAHCLDLIVLKKKKVAVLGRSGENYDGQASDHSILPGLPDDTASDILAWTCRSDYPKLSCVSKRFNLLITSGYLYKLRRRLGVIEHWVYLACILMPWEAFDPVRHRWMRLPRMPCDDCFTYADKESLAVGTELLVFGRELSGFAIWKFSLLTRDWTRCSQMNLPRCLFGSSSHGEIAIVAGGSDKNGNVLNSAELYNSELDTWETLSNMNLPRKLCSGFFMGGKFYVIGGMSSNTNCLTCGEEYNVETRTWRRIEGMYPVPGRAAQSPAMQSPPLVAVVNNNLYAADQATNEVKKYDKINNTWNIVRRLPVRADSSNGWGLAFKACGDKLLVVGGHRGREGEVIVLHSWSPEDGNGDGPEWNILSTRERAGAFVYNCAVMGC